MELNSDIYLQWKEKIISLDLGIPDRVIDEYFFKFNEENIDYVKTFLLTYIFKSPNIINLINVSRNEAYIDLVFDNYDIDLSNINESIKVIYNDGNIVSNIDCYKFKNIMIFDKFNDFLKLLPKDKNTKLNNDFYFIKDRYLNKLDINELFDLCSRSALVKKMFPEVASIRQEIENRLNSLIEIKELVDNESIIVFDINTIKNCKSTTDLSTYIERFRNSQIDLLIDAILCK